MASSTCGLLLLIFVAHVQAECQINAEIGDMLGTLMTSRGGREFCSFRKVPYAEPPIDSLRFKAPVPKKPWTGELDATSEGPSCLQQGEGQEDCLYLNVHTPETTFPASSTLPVIVFLHGGKFEKNSANTAWPHYYLDKDIVLVTVNYRLGVMGFLSTGDDEAPGNFGLKDQSLALKWVRDNISPFGGDPDKVTLQGQSAGAQSTNYHMFSPLSRGLFRFAIGESGSAFKANVIPVDDPLFVAKQQGDISGCESNTTAELVRCLRDIPGRTLVDDQITDVYKPVLEKQTELNPEPFVTAPPLELIQTGNFYKVPWMIGCNSEDGIMFVSHALRTSTKLNNLNKHFDEEAYTDFFFPLSMPEEQVLPTWQIVTDHYLGVNHTITPENVNKFVKMASDRIIIHSVHNAVKKHTEADHSPIYYYEFAYRGEYSYTSKADYGNGEVDLGVGHKDELIYLLPNSKFPLERPEGHPDLEVIDTMVTLWTNFAIHGNPTPQNGDIPQGVIWEPINNNDIHKSYLRIGHDESSGTSEFDILPLKITLEQDLLKERMEFWDNLPLKENNF